MYQDAMALRARPSLRERLAALRELGPFTGPVAIFVHTVQFLALALLRLWRPACTIEPAPDFPVTAFGAKRTKLEQLPLSAAFVGEHIGAGTGRTPPLVVGGIH